MRGSAKTREMFLSYFREKDHHICPSAPVVPHGDPTLLFTNAGMNQFKDIFLATREADHPRVADTQKCIRVSGKHNDLDEVGRDSYHHTFFEMLGNWSFGDYFKREAIGFGWEFLVDRFDVPAERLWVTVFGGDEALGVGADEEAEKLWVEVTGIPAQRVLRFGKKDNFWEMGATGPCGPCSEIHIDLGPAACSDGKHAKDGSDCHVNGECGRYIEIWNLVFIQYNHQPDGTLEELPAKHVDTGMGFERLVALDGVLEKMKAGEPFVFSNYNTDLFLPVFGKLSEICGVGYSPEMDPRQLTAFRVVGDHVRSLCIAIADGVMPDKKGRGSVLRSLVRRAARFGRQVLELDEPFLHLLVPEVAGVYADVFPEVGQRLEHICLVIKAEEESFSRTIDRGIERFAKITREVGKGGTIDGVEAYRLYHQDGFPRDLIDQMAAEHALVVDEDGWKRGEEEHKKASEGGTVQPTFELAELEGLAATEFLGYHEGGLAAREGTEASVRLVKLIGTEVAVLDRTPFYAEAGGQVGDSGVIEAEGFVFHVGNTVKFGGVTVHFGELEIGDLSSLPDEVEAKVDAGRRADIVANHTATHLLHWALRKVLGDHATQQGSLVNPDYLRFDFTHPKAVSRGQIEEIEKLVNSRIARNIELNMLEQSLDEAKARGVTALFGEKYGERVRVVEIGEFSRELCGGTHVVSTGRIGFFRISAESAIQVGVRRIVATTRARAVEEAQAERRRLLRAAQTLSVGPVDLVERIEGLKAQVKELKKVSVEASRKDLGEQRKKMIESFETVGGVKVLVDVLEGADRKQLGSLADALRSGKEPVAGVLVGIKGDVVAVLAFASKGLASQKRIDAGKIVKAMASVAGAKGGGRPDFAQSGWKGTDRIDDAVAAAHEQIRAQLGGAAQN